MPEIGGFVVCVCLLGLLIACSFPGGGGKEDCHVSAMTMLCHRTSTLVPPPRMSPRRAEFDDIANKEEEEEMKRVTTAMVMDGWITILGGVGD